MGIRMKKGISLLRYLFFLNIYDFTVFDPSYAVYEFRTIAENFANEFIFTTEDAES